MSEFPISIYRTDALTVNYRVSWMEDDAANMSMEKMQQKLSDYLKANNNYFSIYLVDMKSIAVNHVPDVCMTNQSSFG